jgi:hypothetical protein
LGKTAYTTARTEPNLKAQCGRVRVPNAQTRKAIDELEAGGGEAFQADTRTLFDKIQMPRKTRKA